MKRIIFLIALLLLPALLYAGDAKYKTIVIKEFSLEGARIQENADTKAFAETLPTDFARTLKAYLEDMSLAENVVIYKEGEVYENAVIVEGNFTKITAGSTAARIIVGFGAGSSTVGAQWKVKDAQTEKELGSFEKNSHSASGVTGAMALRSDSQYLAKYVANTIKKLLK